VEQQGGGEGYRVDEARVRGRETGGKGVGQHGPLGY
jgi:hypothetical protein